jgi:uncharacterized protein (TIGR02118 family)
LDATLLLSRLPAGAGDAWLHRSLAALALRFRDARVRLLIADLDGAQLSGTRVAPPPASFEVVVVIERERQAWPAPSRPELAPPDDALAWLSGARGYRARVRKLRPRPGTPRAGERSPGLVFVATAVRKPSLDAAAFDAHWRDRHAPLALAHHAGMCGYEQLPVTRLLTASAVPIDGLALLHFPDADAFRERFYDSSAGRDAILSDTQQFLDLPRCEAALLGEHWARP